MLKRTRYNASSTRRVYVGERAALGAGWQSDVDTCWERVTQRYDGRASCVHVVPINDLRDHVEHGLGCWCRPEVIDDVVVHAALDQRELVEHGERRVQ